MSEVVDAKRAHELQIPKYTEETVQYKNGQLAIRLHGEFGTKFDFAKHKWSPTEPGEQAIVSTESGNDYYIFTDGHWRTYIVNTGESVRTGRLVAAYRDFPAKLPQVQFGKSWNIPGFYRTTGVERILLRYKIAPEGHSVGSAIDGPNPFDKYQNIVKTYGKNI